MSAIAPSSFDVPTSSSRNVSMRLSGYPSYWSGTALGHNIGPRRSVTSYSSCIREGNTHRRRCASVFESSTFRRVSWLFETLARTFVILATLASVPCSSIRMATPSRLSRFDYLGDVRMAAEEYGSLWELISSLSTAQPNVELGQLYLEAASAVRALLLAGEIYLVRRHLNPHDTAEELLPADALAILRRPSAWHPSEHDLLGSSSIELRQRNEEAD